MVSAAAYVPPACARCSCGRGGDRRAGRVCERWGASVRRRSVVCRRSAYTEDNSARTDADAPPTSGAEVDPAHVGFGAYRVHNVERHRRALSRALSRGVRYIDTAATWANGGSEEMIGEVVEQMTRDAGVAREDLCIVTKAGFLEGKRFDEYLQWQRERQKGDRDAAPSPPTPQPLLYREADGYYCLDRSFLSSELQLSLRRLRLRYVDVFMLQNPEVYLRALALRDDATDSVGDSEERHKRFQEVLREAFVELEQQVQRGNIRAYGVSSGDFELFCRPGGALVDAGGGAGEVTLLTLAQDAAQRAGNDTHHLTTLEVPVNLIEREALRENGVVAWAKQHGLTVLASRPLNAYSSELGVSVRLADGEEVEYDAVRRRTLNELEDNASGSIASVVAQCDKMKEDFRSVVDFETTMTTSVLPLITRLLEQRNEVNVSIVQQVNKYFTVLEQLIKRRCASGANDEVARLQASGALTAPARRQGESLQHFALRWLLSQRLIDVVLVGMRSERYVDDVLSVRM